MGLIPAGNVSFGGNEERFITAFFIYGRSGMNQHLKEKNFPYLYQHLSYDYGSHLFVPMELRSTKFFKGDRGKNKENGRRARMDSLAKTLELVLKW